MLTTILENGLRETTRTEATTGPTSGEDGYRMAIDKLVNGRWVTVEVVRVNGLFVEVIS